jgi:hypothetical protein
MMTRSRGFGDSGAARTSFDLAFPPRYDDRMFRAV